MSRTFPAARGLLLLLGVIGAVAMARPALAAPARFQIEGLGTGSLLSGSASLADQRDRRDYYPMGIGFSLAATLGVTDHVVLGVRTGLFDQRKDDIAPSAALVRWRHLPNYSSSSAAQATAIDRKLTTIPTHAIVQYRGRLAGQFGFYDEIGVGVASFTDKLDYRKGGSTVMRLSAYQKNLSLLAGAGMTWDWKSLASVVGGVSVEMIPSLNGQVWDGGDNPQLVHLQLGVRYPRR